MKTLSEIINESKDGQIPNIDDARLAICALDALATFDGMSIMRLADNGSPKAWIEYEDHFRRWKAALAKAPKDWLGVNNNPDSPECQQRRRVSRKIWDKVLANSENPDAVRHSDKDYAQWPGTGIKDEPR